MGCIRPDRPGDRAGDRGGRAAAVPEPVWVAFEQGRAEATAWTGFSEPELRTATDAILADLVFGPPDFDVAVAGQPVLIERERGHMRDVRGACSPASTP